MNVVLLIINRQVLVWLTYFVGEHNDMLQFFCDASYRITELIHYKLPNFISFLNVYALEIYLNMSINVS